MAKDNYTVTERILNLTLEIIYLLTAQDYTAVKKESGDNETSCIGLNMPEIWRRTQNPTIEDLPHSHVCERTSHKKILEITHQILELLSGEVPIRCQDVSVYFSMEEWEYIEDHKDRYRDVVMEEHQISSDHGPVTNKRFISVEATAGLTSCEVENPTTTTPPTPKEEVRSYQSLHIKEEPCDEGTLKPPKMPTPPDHTQQFQSVKEREEPLSCAKRNLANVDVSPRVQTIKVVANPTRNRGPVGKDMGNGVPPDGHSENEVQKFKLFNCRKCNNNFPTKPLFTLHQKTHIREKPFLCSKCGKCFSKISHYIRHQSVHVGMKPYTCPECGKSFSDRSYLGKHRRMHGDLASKPLKCPECDIRFLTQYELVAHCKIHSGKKPFECAQCGKRFTRNYQLLKHQKVHTGDVPFLCSQCGTCFRDNALLLKHQQYHSKEKQFCCSECGKSFSDRSHYVRHIRIHTGEKPFVCSECGRCFNDKSSLSRHHRLHTGEKPYTCPECGQSFRYNSTLLKHQEVHSLLKSFKCPECDTYFMSNSEFLMHCSLHSEGK